MRILLVEDDTGASRGSGLGLHICKRIAKAYRGSVRVESNQGAGVIAIVTLPLHE
jgi:signal transduction histidine kinase